MMHYDDAPDYIKAAADWLLIRHAERGYLDDLERAIAQIVVAEITGKPKFVVIQGGKK